MFDVSKNTDAYESQPKQRFLNIADWILVQTNAILILF